MKHITILTFLYICIIIISSSNVYANEPIDVGKFKITYDNSAELQRILPDLIASLNRLQEYIILKNTVGIRIKCYDSLKRPAAETITNWEIAQGAWTNPYIYRNIYPWIRPFISGEDVTWRYDTFYPRALHRQYINSDWKSKIMPKYDMEIHLNRHWMKWCPTGYSGNYEAPMKPTSEISQLEKDVIDAWGQRPAQNIIMHEVMHGLGFCRYNYNKLYSAIYGEAIEDPWANNLGVALTEDQLVQRVIPINKEPIELAGVSYIPLLNAEGGRNKIANFYWCGYYTSLVAASYAINYSDISRTQSERIPSITPWGEVLLQMPLANNSHFNNTLRTYFLMANEPDPLAATPDIISVMSMYDIGWGVYWPCVVELRGGKILNDLAGDGIPSLISEAKEFIAIHFSENSVICIGIQLVGRDAGDFLVETNVPIGAIQAGQCKTLMVRQNSATPGIKTAFLVADFTCDGISRRWHQPIYGISLTADSNNDQIEDAKQECPNVYTNNCTLWPFNVAACPSGDCSGNNGEYGADGIPDGLNDWDGDGTSNMLEFMSSERNPIIHDSGSIIDNLYNGASGNVLPISLDNSGPWPIRIVSEKIVGDNDNEFSIFKGVVGQEIAEGDSMTMLVGYFPKSISEKSASLEITYYVGQKEVKKIIPLLGKSI